ncbi:MAG: four helix bundle protein [Bacteroidota bacterium]
MQKGKGKRMKRVVGRTAEDRTSPHDIVERTEDFALRAIFLYRHLAQQERAAQRLADQFLRSATSVGANMAEAQSGETRRDFIHKVSIALKEARESRYWLRLFERAEFVDAESVAPLRQEAHELVAILSAIVVNAKRNGRQRSASKSVATSVAG